VFAFYSLYSILARGRQQRFAGKFLAPFAVRRIACIVMRGEQRVNAKCCSVLCKISEKWKSFLRMNLRMNISVAAQENGKRDSSLRSE
jgi:hypothetical protein